MGDDEALSTNELITLMCRALERKPHIWKINRGLMEFCARLGTLLHLPLNEERLHKLTENYVVSNAKIKAALGIDRMPVRAEEGIVRTIKSFSNNKSKQLKIKEENTVMYYLLILVLLFLADFLF